MSLFLVKVYKEEIDGLRLKMDLGLPVIHYVLDNNIIIHYMNSIGFVLVCNERIHVTWDEYDAMPT